MGQVYSTILTFRIRKGEDQNLSIALSEFLRRKKFPESAISKSVKESLDERLNGMLGLVFLNLNEIEDGKKHCHFEADFDSTYGWEGLMYDTFECMAPYLRDGRLEVWPDNDHYILKAINGKVA